ncbi:gamma-glutamyl-gamma-aminobutyrate hydrolase family protein [Jannaschia sp. Os4]|uniref:gamma-glutamyl-gamma-aminobutyrate hydrolase family protein n=1 Tax=Jannaschia sp. Os4 TaxID=2807617 RepID=UPI001939FA5C|nr:gamma-glutamyl-gamma-aminobutyrate hydrolase family protein [Jannaschia sp. Os4]MBM2575940.1 gamma-glutamyl-gamma-aminobutyrate hydrolase family protein [Jannaschia sp. Os4]
MDPPVTLSLLVVASETPDQMADRRRRSGQASHETFAGTLRQLDDGVALTETNCVTGTDLSEADLARHDGILYAGSPIQMHEDTPEVRAAAAFAAMAFASGTPSFGSCAGLQIATAAAGGTTRARPEGLEAGFARGIVALADHPMLAGRPCSWDAPAMHSAEVDRPAPGTTVVARTPDTPVEAAEIRCGPGVHWGVQYHPELALWEIADALESKADTLVAQGMAEDEAAAKAFARTVRTLDADPSRRDLAWQIGVGAEVLDRRRRGREIVNFLAHLRGR